MLPRLGWPQFFAFLLLLAFLAQALWVIHRRPLLRAEVGYAQAGVDQFAGRLPPRAMGALPVPAAVAAMPVVTARSPVQRVQANALKWTLRLPFLAMGWLLGASLWHVARRLYGDAGGYVALSLYCFSPAVYFTSPGPLLTGALGIFGTVFVAIAASHTLYAPRYAPGTSLPRAAWAELSSRWRRVGLLGLAVALAVGSGYWAVVVVALAAAFMLYLVPERRAAAIGLLAAGCALGALLLLASFGFHPRALAGAVAQASFFPHEAHLSAGEILRGYVAGVRRGGYGPLLLLTGVALGTYVGWRRARYFGNTAPLITLLLLIALGLVTIADVFLGPFPFRATPFVYLFIAGTLADLLETRWRNYALALLLLLLGFYVATSVLAVVRFRASVLY